MPNTELIFDKPHAPATGGKAQNNGNPKKGKGFMIVVIIGVVLVVVLFFAVLSPKTDKSSYVLKMWNEGVVATATIKNTVSSTGVIELKNKDTILAPQTAQVKTVFVASGDTVTKGQALIQLVTTDLEWNLVVSQSAYDEAVRAATMTDTQYDFQIRQQDINIKTGERNLANAQSNLTQTQGLFQRNIASNSELVAAQNSVADLTDSLDLLKLTKEQTIAQHDITLSNRASDLAQKKKAIDDLRTSISDATIRSGINGKVYSLDVAAGDRVSAYSSVAVVANPKDIQAGIDVAENRINEVKLGDPVTVTIGDTAVPATVSSIASSATTSSSSSSSTIRVVADFKNAPSSAIVGGSVSADIEVGIIKDALTLPRGPYLSSGNYASVYVIDGTNRATKKTVSFGITDGTTIQVVSGLAAGDKVITSAYQEYINLAQIQLQK